MHRKWQIKEFKHGWKENDNMWSKLIKKNKIIDINLFDLEWTTTRKKSKKSGRALNIF